jgi:stage II sporulation protein D
MMARRLGWLLLALFCTLKLSHFARAAIPRSTTESSRPASELKISPKIIRVRLSDFGSQLQVKGDGLSASLAMKPELGSVESEAWEIDCKKSKITHPRTGKSRMIPRSGILIESLSGILSVNGRRFRDQVVIYPKELLSPYDASVRSNTQCLVVNHLGVEKYLESVVNGEFNSKWAEPAVEAQIIAARTYAYYQMKEMRRDRGRVYDVESTQRDQVYLGFDVADTKAGQLVSKTKGMILSDPAQLKKNCPIKAFYHASCGGGTFLPKQIWGGNYAGFKKVSCPYCATSPSFHWDYSLSFHEIENRIQKGLSSDVANRKLWPKAYLDQPNRWILNHIRLANESERVSEMIFEFQNVQNQQLLSVPMNAYQARNWFDPSRLKSTRFSLEIKGRLAVFHGKGSGHGVGLCQWGAKKMGEQGFSRDQILTHYYPGFKLVKI